MRPEAAPLDGAVDTEPRQTPVRLFGVPFGHLLQGSERVNAHAFRGRLD